MLVLFCRYPNTACELLTSDVSQINDKLSSDRELVDQLYSFLQADRPLNPLLASFFSKVMGLLITRKSEMVSFRLMFAEVAVLYLTIVQSSNLARWGYI